MRLPFSSLNHPRKKREAKDKAEDAITIRLKELDSLLRTHAKELARQKTTADFQDKAQEMIAPFQEWVQSLESEKWTIEVRVKDIVKENDEYFVKCSLPRQLAMFGGASKPVKALPITLPLDPNRKSEILPGDTLQITGTVRTESIEGRSYIDDMQQRQIAASSIAICKIIFRAHDPIGQKRHLSGMEHTKQIKL